MKNAEDYLALPWQTQVTPEDCTDGTQCYVARVTELPGCESHGDTPEAALANLRDAQRLYLESLLEDGLEPAKPIAVTEGTYSATQSVWRVEHAAESAPPNVIGGVQGTTLPVMA